MSKLKVAQVLIGPVEIQGLMGKDGDFYVSAIQVAGWFGLSQKYPIREIKKLLGENSSLYRKGTELNSRPITLLTLIQFHQVVFRLASRGNEKAIYFYDILSSGPSLRELFCDAFLH